MNGEAFLEVLGQISANLAANQAAFVSFQQQHQQQQQQQHQQQQPPPPPRMPIKMHCVLEKERVSGEEEDPVDKLHFVMQKAVRFLEEAGITDPLRQCKIFVDNCLSDEAYKLASDRLTHGQVGSLFDIQELLTKRFGGFDSVEDARNRIMRLVMQPHAEMEKNIVEFRKHDARIPGAERSEGDRLYLVKLMVRDDAIKQALCDPDIKTWHQAANICNKMTAGVGAYLKAVKSLQGAMGAGTSAAGGATSMEIGAVMRGCYNSGASVQV
jgi:hypothetical protein